MQLSPHPQAPEEAHPQPDILFEWYERGGGFLCVCVWCRLVFGLKVRFVCLIRPSAVKKEGFLEGKEGPFYPPQTPPQVCGEKKDDRALLTPTLAFH